MILAGQMVERCNMSKHNIPSDEQIKELALANGFKLKEQPDGSLNLNDYVYKFARSLIASSNEPPVCHCPKCGGKL